MARSLWKGVLTFGLVSIPVELYPSEERKEFKLSMLDKRDYSPVGYKRYSKSSGKEVSWTDIVKGYEYEKDQYVVLSDEDFRRANVKASQAIEITMFVPQEVISPQYYESPYYLSPDKNGEKVYALLREALRSAERVAVAQFVLRSTQHLAAVCPVGRALMLITLRYADELKSIKELKLPPESLKGLGVTSKEVDLAKRLIEDMTETWDPKIFRHSYHEDLMARIRQKIKKGETHVITKESEESDVEPRSAKVIDLTALLKKSIGIHSFPPRAVSPRTPKRGSKPHLRLVPPPPRARAKRKRS